MHQPNYIIKTIIFHFPLFVCHSVCVLRVLFWLSFQLVWFVREHVSAQRDVEQVCSPLQLCLLMSLKTTKLKVPLLVPEGNQSAFDSLTTLISVLEANSGTDAPGQSLVSLELCLTDHWQVALWHSVSCLTGWQSSSSFWMGCLDCQGQYIFHRHKYWQTTIV